MFSDAQGSRARLLAVVLPTMGCMALAAQAAWSATARPHHQADEPVVFSVVGDAPYSTTEIAILQQHFDAHDLYSPADFLVHVGDIKLGVAPCDEFWYENMATMLRSLSVPAFIVPGDNEWTDCLDRVVAWQYWTKHLMGIEESFCGVPAVETQAVRPENFAFVLKGVLFIGINLVGGAVDRSIQNENADWVHQQLTEKAAVVRAGVVFAQAGPGSNHNTFFDRFVPDAVAFAKPILYAQGDGHTWIEDQPFVATNVTRIQVDRGIVPPVQVTVESNATFQFNRNPWPPGTVALDRPPCADAGPDLIVPEQGVATLRGKASDDGEPFPTQFDVGWTVLDGPGEVVFANAAAPSTTATFDADGTYVLRLTATDGLSVASDETEVTIGGIGPNYAPVAQEDFYEVDVDNTLWVEAPGVLGNDTDANGDALIVSVVTPPQLGSLTLDADGSFTYVPTPGYAGLDRFVYRASDTVADSEAEVWIGVGGAVRTFVIAADAKVRSSHPLINYGNTNDLRVDQDDPTFHSYLKVSITDVGPVRGGVLRLHVQSGSSDGGTIHAVSNNYEGTETPWTETGITWGNAPAITGSALASAGAVLTNQRIDLALGRAIRGPGTWSFGLQNAVPDGVTYSSRESSQPPQLFLAALPPGANLPPAAAADAYMGNEDEVLTVAAPGVMANDTDEDLDPLTVSLASPPLHGTVVLEPDGSFAYTPHRNYAGIDAFAYTVDDGRGSTDAGIATLTINAVNDPPVAKSDVFFHLPGESLVVAAPGVLANDLDVDDEVLTTTLVSGPVHGSLSLANDGSFVYQPGPISTAAEFFIYAVSDGEAVAEAVVSIRAPRDQVVTHLFAPVESRGPAMSKAAAGHAEPPTPPVSGAGLTFELSGLYGKVVGATLRVYDSDARSWLDRDVTRLVTGDGVVCLDMATLLPGVAVDLGADGHPPQLLVVMEGSSAAAARDSSLDDPVPESRTGSAVLRTQLDRVVPSPFHSIVRVEYSLAQSADVELVVYNARGQRVRTLAAERQTAGGRILFWDATDSHGARVPAGIYFLRARLGTQLENRKLVVAH